MAKTNAQAQRQEALAALIEPKLAGIVAKQLSLAEAGDPSAAKLVLGYFAAMPIAPEKTVVLPGLADAKTLVAKVEAVLDAVARGEIGAATGESLMKSLAVLSSAVQVEEFASRLARLEAAAAQRNGALPTAQRIEPQPLPLA